MNMFDEEVTLVKPDGTEMEQAAEMETSVADFVRSAREFRGLDSRPGAADDPERRGILWWRALEFLALADSRLKDCFCARDRSPASIAQYHRWKLKMLGAKRYRTDA